MRRIAEQERGAHRNFGLVWSSPRCYLRERRPLRFRSFDGGRIPAGCNKNVKLLLQDSFVLGQVLAKGGPAHQATRFAGDV